MSYPISLKRKCLPIPAVSTHFVDQATCTVSSSSYEYYSYSDDEPPPPSAKDIKDRFEKELGHIDLEFSDGDEEIVAIEDHE
eukprot:s779_g19.t1